MTPIGEGFVCFCMFGIMIGVISTAFFLSQITVYFISIKYALRSIHETLSQWRKSDTRSDDEEA